MSKEYNAANEREFLLEVRDFYWRYLQEYAKKENTPMSEIHEGIRMVRDLDALCKGDSYKDPETDANTSTAKAISDWCEHPGTRRGSFLRKNFLDLLYPSLPSKKDH